MIDTTNMSHAEIVELRERLKAEDNKNYLQRDLWYDYKNQCWIEPDRILEEKCI